MLEVLLTVCKKRKTILDAQLQTKTSASLVLIIFLCFCQILHLTINEQVYVFQWERDRFRGWLKCPDLHVEF